MKKIYIIYFAVALYFIGAITLTQQVKADTIACSEYSLTQMDGAYTWARTSWNLYWESGHVNNVSDLATVESLMCDGYIYMSPDQVGQRNGITDFHPHPHTIPPDGPCALEFEFNGGTDYVLDELSFFSSRMWSPTEIIVDYALDGGGWITAVITDRDELGWSGTGTYTIDLGGVKADRFRFVTISGNMIIHEVTISGSHLIIVPLDIKPGSDPNSINCDNENGVIAVAILTTDVFDATTVDHTTVTFEGASETHVNNKSGEPKRHEEDVDGDGDTDLLFHFRLGETELTCDSTEGTLVGETFDGIPIEGTDSITSEEPDECYAGVPQTGQTKCYNTSGIEIPCAGTGQDGEFQNGVAWPSERFIDNWDGTVTDKFTGLIWLQNANCFGSIRWYSGALMRSNALASGQCDLSDNSVAGDWRLPNVRELQSLIDFSNLSPALPSGHPFTDVQPGVYWTSTSYSEGNDFDGAWGVFLGDGSVYPRTYEYSAYVWPVRGGN